MKTLRNLLYLFLISLVVISCDERDFDTPPINIPEYAGDPANITIQELKTKYTQTLPTLVDTALIFEARVIGNDESGNIFKQLVVQDSTGGIVISVDQTGMFGLFRIGQKVFVNLKGLYIGKYGNEHQIGTIYNGSIGRMTLLDFNGSVFRDGWPRPDLAVPLTVKIIDLGTNSDRFVNTLVRIENVSFNNGGVAIFAPQTVTTAQDEIVTDLDGKTMTVRTSKYANFAADILPEGVGTIVGVLGRYNGTWQFTIRDRDDLIDFTVLKGTKGNPFTVTEALEKGVTADKWWVKGYIIGSVAPGINASNPINSNDDIITSGEFTDLTVVIAENAGETDWRKCMVVNLPAGSAIRTKLNLLDNPSNKGKELTVLGNFQLYFGAAGVNVANGTSDEFIFESTSTQGDGSKENPYNFDQARAKQGETAKWVKAYIVGNVDGTGISLPTESKFAAPFTIATNFLIAASPDEKNYANCIPVQLPAGVRAALNLVDNAGNLGKEVTLLGDLVAYFGAAGIKNVTDYVLDGGSVIPPTPTDAIFNETFGTEIFTSANRPKINTFTGYDMKAPIVFSDQSEIADIRNLSGGNAHVWFPANKDAYLTISGINTTEYKNIVLSYELAANLYNAGESIDQNKLIVRCNGTDLVVPSKVLSNANGDNNKFTTIEISNITSGNITIEFFSSTANNTFGLRLDNIKITGDKK